MTTIHNSLAQMPELLRAYLLATGLAENEEGVIRLGETLTPIVDIWRQPEWALLRGETPWVVHRNSGAGGATTMSGVAIVNPTGSGIVSVVEKAKFNLAVAGTPIAVAILATQAVVEAGMTTAAQVSTRDRRRQLTAITVCRSGAPVGLLTGTEIEYETGVTVTCRMQNLPIILYPGQAYVIQSNDDNSAVSASFIGYERKCVLNEARG